MGLLLSEVGGFRKRKARLRIALVYPNVYRIGISSLGLHTVYSLFNQYDDIACERFFLGIDRSMESNSPLRSFDVIAFSLQYELDYLNLVRILVNNQIEPLREKRSGPMIIAGGPCCFNPLTLTKFVDLFIIGDLEPLADRLADGLLQGARAGELASKDGVFSSDLMNRTRASIAPNLDTIPAPTNQPRPTSQGFGPALGSTFMVEISRGCDIRCRFCTYSHCTSPKRERSLERVQEIVDEGIRVTGANKVSLVGALVTDHSDIKGILSYLADKGVSVSLPSIRTDGVDEELLELLKRLAIRTLTIAPEGSPKVRSVLKKALDEEKLKFVCENAQDFGIRKLKLYFITGVPAETKADVQYISRFCAELVPRYSGKGAVTASVNPLIPKPHAPSERLPMASPSAIKENYSIIQKGFPTRATLKLKSVREATIQAYLALGDHRAAETLWRAWNSRGLGRWRRESHMAGDPIERVFEPRSELPWKMIETGIPRAYLERQSKGMWRAQDRHLGAGKH